jgi:hypothetical protein
MPRSYSTRILTGLMGILKLGYDSMEVFLHVYYVSMRDEDEIHLIHMPLALHSCALFTMI